MPRVAARAAERALPLLIRRPLRPVHSHICRSCLTRQFGTTLSRSANIPWYKRAKEFFFGSKESKQAEQKREEAEQAREEASASGDQPVVEEPAVPRPRPTALEVIPGRNGRQFQVAAVVKQELDMDYVPADNWAGLERIGSRQWQREKADHGEKYTGFIPEKTLQLDARQWQALLHHVLVEVLALKDAGRPLSDVCHARKNHSAQWAITARTRVASNLSLRPQRKNRDGRDGVLSGIPAQDDPNPTAPRIRRLTHNYVLQERIDWNRTPIHDAAVKFAIQKRILQLTSHRIPDAALAAATTLRALHSALAAKPAPKRLADSHGLRAANRKLPNVTVYATRRTPIHKHQEVGRWKLIVDELKARDLPVTGSRWVDAKPRVD